MGATGELGALGWSYAPTYTASREENNEFFDSLQHALTNSIYECFVVLGDLNVRVGSSVVRCEGCPHGHGSLNEAGKELLSFLSINDTTVCNTWFEKAIHSRPGSIGSRSSGTALTTPS